MGFIRDTNSLIYLKRVNQSVHSHNTIDEQFKDTDKQLLDLLKELLQFNPTKRKTARELLDLDIFDEIRSPELESIGQEFQIQLQVDKIDSNLDFNNIDKQNEEMLVFQKLILKEQKKLKNCKK